MAISTKIIKKVKLNLDNLINAYNSGCQDVKETLKKLYPDVEFEKKLAESWGEYCALGCNFEEITKMISIGHKQYANTSLDNKLLKYTALYKLELLRDHYNGDWKDSKHENIKYILEKNNGGIDPCDYINCSSFLTFRTPKLRDKFLTNFKDLIEQAEDLI